MESKLCDEYGALLHGRTFWSRLTHSNQGEAIVEVLHGLRRLPQLVLVSLRVKVHCNHVAVLASDPHDRRQVELAIVQGPHESIGYDQVVRIVVADGFCGAGKETVGDGLHEGQGVVGLQGEA